jgi:two-component system cell cycle response regulator CpdR
MRILLVEDDPNTLALLGTLLNMEGHNVDSCAGSALALQRLRSEPYSLLLTDHVMPGMTGLELTRAARALQAQIRCMIMSGHAPPDGAELHVIEWLTKPLDIDALLDTLERD